MSDLVLWVLSATHVRAEADDRSSHSLERCGLVHYSSRTLLRIMRERKRKWVVNIRMGNRDMIRIVYLVCYAMMLPSSHALPLAATSCLMYAWW
jgi:hypothetical protein